MAAHDNSSKIELTGYLGPAGQGSSQAQVMNDAQGNLYYVKFQENGQDLRILANEFMAAKMAEKLSLPIAKTHLATINDLLLPSIPKINGFNVSNGPHFASNKIENTYSGPAIRSLISNCTNLSDYPSIILFDAMLVNADRNNDGNYLLQTEVKGYKFCVIDHGHCFGFNWNALNIHLIYGMWSSSYLTEMYETILGESNFTISLENIASLDDNFLINLVESVPNEWLPHQPDKIAVQNFAIYQRNAIHTMLIANKNKFKNWL